MLRCYAHIVPIRYCYNGYFGYSKQMKQTTTDATRNFSTVSVNCVHTAGTVYTWQFILGINITICSCSSSFMTILSCTFHFAFLLVITGFANKFIRSSSARLKSLQSRNISTAQVIFLGSEIHHIQDIE